jgi:OOP family OmpA-OmpF porin
MYVDLGDYRYISAQRSGAEGPEWVALLVSRTDALGFVQITRVAPVQPGAADLPSATPPPAPGDGPSELAALLKRQGHAVLWDLAFPIGSAELGPGSFASLEALAEVMRMRSDLRILLVGHTDADGALPGNIALSRRRAEAVRSRLADRYDIAPERVRAEGVGYLAPIATNATAEGRERNRRVEVVVDTGR